MASWRRWAVRAAALLLLCGVAAGAGLAAWGGGGAGGQAPALEPVPPGLHYSRAMEPRRTAPSQEQPEAVPGELIVGFAPGAAGMKAGEVARTVLMFD